MGQVTWFCTKWDQVTWIRKIVDQVTWETKCEDQITSTTILQKWTRLPGGGGAMREGRGMLALWHACGKDRWASEWHLVFHQLALQLSGPVQPFCMCVVAMLSLMPRLSRHDPGWGAYQRTRRVPTRHAPPPPNWPRPGNLAHFWPRPGNLVHQVTWSIFAKLWSR